MMMILIIVMKKNTTLNYLRILKEKKIGQNDDYICELISKDSIEKFIEEEEIPNIENT